MKTLAEVRAIVRFRGDFRNTARFPDANVDTEIQAAHCEWYELVAGVNEGYFDTEANVSTVASQAYVALPAGTWRVRGIDRLDCTEYVPLHQIGVAERNRYGRSTSHPAAWRLTARGADLFPTPDAVYSLRVTYTPVAPDLGAGTDFYNSWEEYVVYATLLRLALNEERSTGEWQAQVDRQAARIVAAAGGRRSAEPEQIPLMDYYVDDDARRWR